MRRGPCRVNHKFAMEQKDISERLVLTPLAKSIFEGFLKQERYKNTSLTTIIDEAECREKPKDEPFVVGQIEYLQQDHGDCFVLLVESFDDTTVTGKIAIHGSETVIGDVADEWSLFSTDKERRVVRDKIRKRLDVSEKFRCTHRYDEKDGRFLTMDDVSESQIIEIGRCVSLKKTTFDTPGVHERLARERNDEYERSIQERKNNPELYTEYWRKQQEKPYNAKTTLAVIFVTGRERGFVMYRPNECFEGEDEEYAEKELVWSGKEVTFWTGDVYKVHDVAMYEEDRETADFFCERAYGTGEIPRDLPRPPAPLVAPAGPKTPLRMMDVFAGMGGICIGMEETGHVRCDWAVELNTTAACTFKKNHPHTNMFKDDVNSFLRRAMNDDPQLPKPGEVDVMAGGPPCQGYSGLNRFSSGDKSRMKSGLVATYLSLCEVYRPKFFVLENVTAFAIQNKGTAARLVLKMLVAMGYQCSVAVVRAADYGIAQARRRVVVLGSRPDVRLPRYPKPTHSVDPGMVTTTGLNLGGMNINPTYDPDMFPRSVYRQITVTDVVGDLPPETTASATYASPPKTDAQRYFRKRSSRLTSHVIKDMGEVTKTRLRHLPIVRGANWCDLPNMAAGPTKRLKYVGDQKGEDGGVGDDRQVDTMIPSCLPHRAKKHGFRACYGRVDPHGIFQTLTTVPRPTCKQGEVVHPTLPRILSVREYARAQHVPDHIQFEGDIDEAYCMLGNAVPTRLGYVIAKEIAKCCV